MSENAREQAKAQLNSIKELVAALDVDYDLLDELQELQKEGMGVDRIPELEELEAQANGCTSREEAESNLHESHLSLEIRTDWFTPTGVEEWIQPSEFKILLCTGGPAVQLIGDLDDNLQPYKVWMQYQDWGTPWADYSLTSEEKQIVLQYCQQFWFGG